MLVVADTSPLNYLVWTRLDHVLPNIYGQILIPPEVRDELLASETPIAVRNWAGALPSWIEVRPADAKLANDPRLYGLDIGERAAIALAAGLRADALLIDERAGSAVARSLGLRTAGTLGLLDEAARRRLISFPEAIERLKQTSFRYPRAIVARLLEEHRSRSD